MGAYPASVFCPPLPYKLLYPPECRICGDPIDRYEHPWWKYCQGTGCRVRVHRRGDER